MSEMVERMARAMFPQMMLNASPGERETAHDLARAALAELREPTQAMVDAPPLNRCSVMDTDVRQTWTFMVDEALR